MVLAYKETHKPMEQRAQIKKSTPICCCSVIKSCPTLCNPMDCSTPGFPVLHHLPEFAQTHVHWVSDALQPSHPLSPPSYALNLSQHQGPFPWTGSSHQTNDTEGPDIKIPCIYGQLIFDRGTKNINEKRIVSLYMVLGKLDIHMQKRETDAQN